MSYLSKNELLFENINIINQKDNKDRIVDLLYKCTQGLDNEEPAMGIINFEWIYLQEFLSTGYDVCVDTVETNTIISHRDLKRTWNKADNLCIIEVKKGAMEWSSVYEEISNKTFPIAVIYVDKLNSKLRYSFIYKK